MIDEPHADSATAGKATAERVARADTHVPTPRAAGGRRPSRDRAQQPSHDGADAVATHARASSSAAAVGGLVAIALMLLLAIVAMERRRGR